MGRILAAAGKSEKGGGSAIAFDVAAVLDKVRKMTDPKSRIYDKNFTAGLGSQKDEIVKFLEEANTQLVKSGFGPGSLVVRQRLAKAGEKLATGMAGALSLGLLSGNPVIAGAGAIMGSRIPENLAEMLLTPGGRKFLKGYIARSQLGIDVLRADVR